MFYSATDPHKMQTRRITFDASVFHMSVLATSVLATSVLAASVLATTALATIVEEWRFSAA